MHCIAGGHFSGDAHWLKRINLDYLVGWHPPCWWGQSAANQSQHFNMRSSWNPLNFPTFWEIHLLHLLTEKCDLLSLAKHNEAAGCRHRLPLFLPLLAFCSRSSYCESRHYREHQGVAWKMNTDMVSGLLHCTSTGNIFNILNQTQTFKLHPRSCLWPCSFPLYLAIEALFQSYTLITLCTSDVSHRLMGTHLPRCPCHRFRLATKLYCFFGLSVFAHRRVHAIISMF